MIDRRISRVAVVHVLLGYLSGAKVDVAVLGHARGKDLAPVFHNQLGAGDGACAVSAAAIGHDCLRASIHKVACRIVPAVKANQLELELVAAQDVFFVLAVVGLVGRKVGRRDQVVVDVHVRLSAATLEVEEVEGVVRAGLEGLALPLVPVSNTSSRKEAEQRPLRGTVDNHVAGLEVNVNLGAVMDAARVAHQHAVNVDPHIVVARELKLHGLVDACGVEHLAVRGHGELRVDVRSHPEVLGAKGPEAANLRVVGGLLGKRERLGPRVKVCPVVTAVVGVVALAVHIEQLVDSRIARLAAMRNGGVEQVGQRLAV